MFLIVPSESQENIQPIFKAWNENRSGDFKWTPKWFMSDDGDAIWNAWRGTFGSRYLHLIFYKSDFQLYKKITLRLALAPFMESAFEQDSNVCNASNH